MPTHKLTREESLERRTAILRLRREHHPWETIAAQFDISKQRAYAIYRDALKEEPVAQLEEHRAEECVLIDTAVRELLTIAGNPETSDRTKVEAWNTLKGWSEWRGRLLGLPAPQQVAVHHTGETDFDRAFAEMAAAIRLNPKAQVIDAEVVSQIESVHDSGGG